MTTVEPGRPKIRGLVEQAKIIKSERLGREQSRRIKISRTCADQILFGCTFSLVAYPYQRTNISAKSSDSHNGVVTQIPNPSRHITPDLLDRLLVHVGAVNGV